MTKEELKAYLKENLKLECEIDQGSFGEPDHLQISLTLEDESLGWAYIKLGNE